MALTSPIPESLGSKRCVRDGPDFAVAVAEAQSGTVRVHLIGRLEAATTAILTSSLEFLHEGDSVGDVEIDLSALSFIDAAGMSELRVNRLLLESAGWTVKSALPRGAELHLLDCAAWAGWAPPHLTCTDILHWKPRPSSLPPRSVTATRSVTGLARPARSGITRLTFFASAVPGRFETAFGRNDEVSATTTALVSRERVDSRDASVDSGLALLGLRGVVHLASGRTDPANRHTTQALAIPLTPSSTRLGGACVLGC
jgi:hypothetical protein